MKVVSGLIENLAKEFCGMSRVPTDGKFVPLPERTFSPLTRERTRTSVSPFVSEPSFTVGRSASKFSASWLEPVLLSEFISVEFNG